MLLFCCLEVGHVHTAAFVISERPINHGRAVSMPSGFALQVACPSGCPGSNLHVLPPFLRLLSLCALTPWNGSPCMPSVHIPLSPLSFYQLQFPLSLPLELKFYVLHRLSNQKADTLASLKVWKSHVSPSSPSGSLYFSYFPTVLLLLSLPPPSVSSSLPQTITLLCELLSRTCISTEPVRSPSADTFWSPGVLTNLVPLTHLSPFLLVLSVYRDVHTGLQGKGS